MKTPGTLVLFFLCSALLSLSLWAQEPELTQEIADRYEQMLLRSPDAGTAFDRVTQWYATEGGGLEKLEERWAEAAGADPDNQSNYLLLRGLLAERQRDPVAARDFYQQALKVASDPARAARMLAELEALEGNLNAAAEAYEQALASDSLAPVDKIDLLRDLALVRQRNFEQDKALEVWERAMAEFGQDGFVLEEAGEAFLDAGEYDRARKAFDQLKELARTDPFKRIAATLRLARSEELAGNEEEAIAIYDAALDETSEGSWQNREIRSRIEELFRRKDDLPGLLDYYSNRAESNPRDYRAFAARSAVEYDLGRTNEAVETLRKAIELAPGQAEFRIDLARLLVEGDRLDEAIEVAKNLAREENAPTSAILLLGDLQWRKADEEQSDEARQAAIETWSKIAPEGTTDASAVAQLAEIYASRQLTDLAIEQWKRLMEVAPPAADARQRLAAIYFEEGNEAEGMKVLDGMISEDATGEDFLRLSRIYLRLDRSDDALAAAEKGLEAASGQYDLLNHTWKLYEEAENYDEAIALFARVWNEAPNTYFAADAVKRFAILLDSAEKTDEMVEQLRAKLDAAEALADHEQAILFELAAQRRDRELAEQILEASGADENGLVFLQMKSTFAERFEGPAEQIAALEKIAQAEPRLATDSLKKVAEIRASEGNAEAALQTVEELIERAPGDPEFYRLYADIATRMGRASEATELLEKGMRFVDDANPLRLQLADLLTQQGRTTEAYELLTEAFEQSDDESARMDLFRRLAEMAIFSNAVDELIASLEQKQAKEIGGARYGRYLAEIYISQNDFGSAREELMKSLGRNPDDPGAVRRLMDLAAREGNQEEVLRLAMRLAELEPSAENRAEVARLLFEDGRLDEAKQMLQTNRESIRQEPSAWMNAIMAAHRAGANQEFDEIVEMLASRAEASPADRQALGMLLIASGEKKQAEKIFLDSIDTPAFAEAIGQVPPYPRQLPPGVTLSPQQHAYNEMRALSQYAASVSRTIQQMYQPGNRMHGISSLRSSFPTGGAAVAGVGPSRDQEALLESFFTLLHLAWASGDAELQEKIHAILERQPLESKDRIVLLASLGNEELLVAAIRDYLANGDADADLDRFLYSIMSGFRPSVDLSDAHASLEERISQQDPDFAFQLLLAEASKDARAESSPERDWTSELLAHPGLGKDDAIAHIQIAMVALHQDDLEQAGSLYEQARLMWEKALENQPGMRMGTSAIIWSFPARLAAAHLAEGNIDGARTWLSRALQELASATQSQGTAQGAGLHFSRGSSHNYQFLNRQNDLQHGSPTFPWQVFQVLAGNATKAVSDEDLAALSEAGLEDPEQSRLLRFYGAWRKGDRLEAVEGLASNEELTDGDYALLLEAYDVLNKPAEALAVIDEAPVGPGETAESRLLRKVRLLREAGKPEEARAGVERLATMRLDSRLRNNLSNEMRMAGIDTSNHPRVTHSTHRTISPSDRLRNQLQTLGNEKKFDQLDTLASQILRRPLPDLHNHHERNLRSNVINILDNADRLNVFQEELREKIANNPEDHESGIRLAELLARKDRDEAARLVRQTVRQAPPDPRLIAYAFNLSKQLGQESDPLELFVELARSQPGHPYFHQMRLTDVMNMGRDGESILLLAELLAEMNDDQLRDFLLPTRLAGQSNLSTMYLGLAEASVRAERIDHAIRLLELTTRGAQTDPMTRLSAFVRLAELQLESDDESGARESLARLFAGSPSQLSMPGYGIFRNRALSLDSVILNVLSQVNYANRGQGAPEERIQRLIELTEELGMTDELLAAVDQQDDASAAMYGSITPLVDGSTVVRTILQRPEVIDEWQELLEGAADHSYLSPGLAGYLMQRFAGWEAAHKLMPGLMQAVVGFLDRYSNADQNLAYLESALPGFSVVKDDELVDDHIEEIIASVSRDPNIASRMQHSRNYAAALRALVDAGRIEHAKSLLALSDTVRDSPNVSPDSELMQVAARIRALTDDASGFTFACMLVPAETGGVLHWQAAASPPRNPSSNQPSTFWSAEALPVSRNALPDQLEIFAGKSPASLERVARVSNVKAEGSVKLAKLPPNVGLLQVRWQDDSGAQQFGPLSPYLIGRNLIELDPEKLEKQARTFLEEANIEAGTPVEGMTSLALDLSLPTRDLEFVPAEVPVAGEKFGLVTLGWFEAPARDGASASLQFISVREDGDESRYSSQSVRQENHWVPFFGGVTHGLNVSGLNGTPSDTEAIRLRVEFQPRTSYNGLYVFKGKLAGLQLVKLPQEDFTNVSQLLSKARSSDPAKAVELYRKAFEADPSNTTRRYPDRVLAAFKETGKLDELFRMVSEPALYMSNPLQGNRPSIRNKAFVRDLARAAIAPDAPKSAAGWLERVESVDLDPELEFQVEIALLLARQDELDRAELSEAIATVLGFAEGDVDNDRIGNIWSDDDSIRAVADLIAAVEENDAEMDLLKLVEDRQADGDYLSAQRLLEARLLASGDPVEALERWNTSVALRRSINRARINYDAWDSVLTEIAATHPEPRDVFAALTGYAADRSGNLSYQKRYLAEALFDISQSEASQAKQYREFHAREELAGLRIPDYRTDGNRIEGLVEYLTENEKWDELAELVNIGESHSSFRSTSVKAKLERISEMLAVVRGQLGEFWPVVWSKPGTGATEVEVFYRWGPRTVIDRIARYDTAVCIGGSLPVDELDQQRKVEIRFGSHPRNLTPIAELPTQAVEGSTSLTLPASNGFLQAVAYLDDQQVEGPLTPVISGKRIFPSDDQNLGKMLLEGVQPLERGLVEEVGTAPDGSIAYRIGKSSGSRSYQYEGPKFEVEPDRFYVVRCWIKRSGDGRADVSVVYEADEEERKRALSMVVSEKEFDTDRWVLYTRAVPTFDQHTFWIPNDVVATVQPQLRRASNGTEIAGFELIDVTDWDYGKWMGEIAMLRESWNSESARPEELDTALNLARYEPLTALDYHGDWLIEEFGKHGRAKDVFELYQSAFDATPNPLVAVPKVWRLAENYVDLLDQAEGQPELQWEVAIAAIPQIRRVGWGRGLDLRARLLEIGRNVGKPEQALAVAREFLLPEDEEATKNLFERAFSTGSYRNYAPTVPIYKLLAAVGGEGELLASFEAQLRESDGGRLSTAERNFVRLGILASIPGQTESEEWQEQLDSAYAAIAEANDINDALYFAHALADLLVEAEAAPQKIQDIRKRNFEAVLNATEDSERERKQELVRAGRFLILFALENENPDLAAETTLELTEGLASRNDKLGTSYLYMLQDPLDALAEAEMIESRNQLLDSIREEVLENSSARRRFKDHLGETAPEE